AIDPHVHFGYMSTFEEQCRKDTRAAAIGGVTTVQVFKGMTDEEYEHYKDAATELSMVDYTFSPIIKSADEAANIDRAISQWGVTSFKFFMAYRAKEGASLVPGSTPNNLNDGLMYDTFKQLAVSTDGGNMPACVHAENYEI